MLKESKTALVTGANSGLGFEAAAQLATLGFERVVLACRTLEKGQTAQRELVARTGRDPFIPFALDVSDNAEVPNAVERFAELDLKLDYLLLNAGLVGGSEIRRSVDGIELTVAASLVGHHIFTTGLLNAELLQSKARIVIAGSEAARNDVPGMRVTDFAEYARIHHDGDMAKTIVDVARVEAPYTYTNMHQYANAKVFVAWWAAALARRVPAGMVVNAVSPGSAPATNAMRNLSLPMKVLMSLLFRVIGPLVGAASPVPKAARRYLDALDRGPETNGKFYASRPGKMIGAVVEQDQAHIVDHDAQEALWRALLELTNGVTVRAVPTVTTSPDVTRQRPSRAG